MKPEEAMQIAQSYARLSHLRNATIRQIADDAEIKGLVEYLAPKMLEHASEFIGSWFVCQNEYQGFINAMLPIARRLLGTMQQQQQAQAAQQAAGAAIGAAGPSPVAESKIVGLDGNPTNQ